MCCLVKLSNFLGAICLVGAATTDSVYGRAFGNSSYRLFVLENLLRNFTKLDLTSSPLILAVGFDYHAIPGFSMCQSSLIQHVHFYACNLVQALLLFVQVFITGNSHQNQLASLYYGSSLVNQLYAICDLRSRNAHNIFIIFINLKYFKKYFYLFWWCLFFLYFREHFLLPSISVQCFCVSISRAAGNVYIQTKSFFFDFFFNCEHLQPIKSFPLNSVDIQLNSVDSVQSLKLKLHLVQFAPSSVDARNVTHHLK